MENVHFSDGTGSEVLGGVDLEVDPGEIVAVGGARAPARGRCQFPAALLRPDRRPHLIGGLDSRDIALAEPSPHGGARHPEKRSCSTTRCATTAGRAPRRGRASGRRGEAAGVATFVTASPTATTRRSGSGRAPLRRAAPAGRNRARPHRPSESDRPGRPDVCRRHRDGALISRLTLRPGRGGTHRPDSRSAALDHPRRGPGHCAPRKGAWSRAACHRISSELGGAFTDLFGDEALAA